MENYTVGNSRPDNLPSNNKSGSSRLQPAQNQAINSSSSRESNWGTELETRSKVLLFLSFHRNQEMRTTTESKQSRSAFWRRFLTAFHQPMSSRSLTLGESVPQPTLCITQWTAENSDMFPSHCKQQGKTVEILPVHAISWNNTSHQEFHESHND